jgi:hypothetical protein
MIKKLLFSLFLVLVQFGIFAQSTNTYTGSNGDWNAASNWSLNLVPTATHDVVIPSGITVNISADSFARTVSVSGTLTINNGIRLTVYNDFTVNSFGTFKMPLGSGYAILLVYWNYYNNGTTDFWKSDVVIGGDLISPLTSSLQKQGDVVVGGNIIGLFDTTGGTGTGQIYAVNPNATVTISPTSIDDNVAPGSLVPSSEGVLVDLVNIIIYGGSCPFTISGTINSSACVSGNAIFTVSVSESSPSYQWEVNMGSGWSDLSNNTVYSGVNTSILTVSNITAMMNNYKFRARITVSGCTKKGDYGFLTVNAQPTTPTITTPDSTTFCAGGSVTLTSSAGTSYLWSTGATTSSISPTISGSYSVKVTNAGGCSSLSSLETVVTVNTLPVIPTFTITNIDCSNSTGSVTLNNLPTGNWIINPGNISGSGSSFTIKGLTVVGSPYYYTVTNSNGCGSSSTGSISIIDHNSSTTWNGTGWTNGLPDMNKKIIFSGNFSSTSDLVGCSCLITTGNVIINSTHTLTLTNEVTVSGGNLIFKSDLDSPSNSSASLVQINNVTSNNNSGTIKYERITNTVIRNTDYTYWSSPVYPQILSSLSPNTLADKYFSYEVTASSEDWKQESSGNIMSIGKGYIIRGPEYTSPPSPPSLFLATFKGVPNNGHYAITSIFPNKSYLIGNPYPSALDADKFLTDNAGVLDGTIYFWTHNTNIGVSTVNLGSGAYAYTSDDYASYNLTGGVGTDGVPYQKGGVSVTSTIPNGKIAAGQGFFISSKETITVPNEIIFNNDMRVNSSLGNNSQFFKIAAKSNSSIEKNRIWLGFSNSQGAFKQTLLGYVTGATNNYDSRYDGETFDGNEFVDFYTINKDKKLVIQGRSLPFEETDEVSLGFKTTIVGSFAIAINQKDGFFTTQNIFIEDKLLNVVHDLNQSSYNFTTEAGTFNDRFVLRYTDKALGTKSYKKPENTVLVSNVNKQITINSSIEMIDKVQIYDLLGRSIYQKMNINTNELIIQNSMLTHQTLLIKVLLHNGQIVTSKIMH